MVYKYVIIKTKPVRSVSTVRTLPSREEDFVMTYEEAEKLSSALKKNEDIVVEISDYRPWTCEEVQNELDLY